MLDKVWREGQARERNEENFSLKSIQINISYSFSMNALQELKTVIEKLLCASKCSEYIIKNKGIFVCIVCINIIGLLCERNVYSVERKWKWINGKNKRKKLLATAEKLYSLLIKLYMKTHVNCCCCSLRKKWLLFDLNIFLSSCLGIISSYYRRKTREFFFHLINNYWLFLIGVFCLTYYLHWMGKNYSSRQTYSKDFQHNHSYYNRECKICRQYVKDIYNNYFDAYSLKTMSNR
jgi:hypothetical membrane protein